MNGKTNLVMEKSKNTKLTWIKKKDHFVYYPKAKLCIEALEEIYRDSLPEQEEDKQFFKDLGVLNDFPYDMEGISLIGYSGAGKSAIIAEFIRRHSIKNTSSYDSVYEEYPVRYSLLQSADTGLKGLYSALLKPFLPRSHHAKLIHKMTRNRDSIKSFGLHDQLVYYLEITNVKLFFIDEFQHAGRGRHSQAILDQLKRTMLASQTPFIPVGTPEVVNILSQDHQLANRCPVKSFSNLDYWNFEKGQKDFRAFLRGYEGFLPFPEPSNLFSKDLAKIIFDKVRYNQGKYKETTNLRDLTRYLRNVAKIAIKNDNQQISEKLLLATPYESSVGE